MYVRDVVVRVPRRAVERQDDQTEHIERRESRGHDAETPKQLSVVRKIPRSPEHGILAEETGERWYSRDGNRRNQECAVGPGHLTTQSAHFANVLQATHTVNDAAGS